MAGLKSLQFEAKGNEMRMRADIRAKWLAALRSGQYEQGRNYLLKNGGYCCLGVLCDLSVTDGIGQWINKPGYTEKVFATKDGYYAYEALPDIVREWAGLPPSFGELGKLYDGRGTLSTINDGGADFATIALIIEEQTVDA